MGGAAGKSGRGHRRVQSDAQASPTMERPPLSGGAAAQQRSRGGSPDEEVDPFRKQRKRPVGLTPQLRGGSFRKIFSSPEESVTSPSEDVTPGVKKKTVINKLLSRARANTRDRLHGHSRTDSDASRETDWGSDSDESSDTGSRVLERQDSVVIHYEAEEPEKFRAARAGPRVPLDLAAAAGAASAAEEGRPLSGRQRGGAMIVKEAPIAMTQAVQATLARILATYQACAKPLEELEAMRLEGEANQDDTAASLTLLNTAAAKAMQSNLSDYEEVAEELASDPLMNKFRFGNEQLVALDDKLTHMEMLVLASIKSSHRGLYLNYAITALCIGMLLAWIFGV